MRYLASTLAGSAVLSLVLIGCGNDAGGGDAERFCGEVEANKNALTNPQLEFADDVEPYIDLYRSIGEFAPLSIEEEWDQLTLNYETASTVVLGDTESEQLAVVTALQTEESAAKVGAWLRETCAVDLGPLSTIVAHDG